MTPAARVSKCWSACPSSSTGSPPSTDQETCGSWAFQLLPHLEQTSVYFSTDIDVVMEMTQRAEANPERLVAIGTAFRAAESRRLLPRLWSDEIDVDQLEPEDGHELEGWILDEDFLRKLHALVEHRCTSDDRVVLLEMGLRGRSGKEVGAMLGKSESAVFTRLCRLRRDVLPLLVKELLAEHRHHDARRPRDPTASCLLATFLALAHHELEPITSAATSNLAANGG
mgnify:CR=1 FL=1